MAREFNPQACYTSMKQIKAKVIYSKCSAAEANTIQYKNI